MNPFDNINKTDSLENNKELGLDTRYVVILKSPREGDILIKDGTKEGYPLLFNNAFDAMEYARTTVKPYVSPDVYLGYGLYRDNLKTPIILNVSQA